MLFLQNLFVYAADPDQWKGLENTDVATFASLETIFSNILNIVSVLAGIAVFVMLILGSISLLTSGGDPEKVKKATGQLTWAIVGLFLMIAVWFIFRLIQEFTGVNITEFKIPGS